MTGPILNWLPKVVLGLLFSVGCFVFIQHRRKQQPVSAQFFAGFAITAVVFRLGYALLLSILQYALWNSSDFTRVLLNEPVSPNVPILWYMKPLTLFWESEMGYFYLYIFGRFWLQAMISIGATAAFGLFLWLFRQYRKESLDVTDVAVGLFCCALVGWPRVILFIPLALFVVAIFLVVLRAKKQGDSVALAGPLLVAAGVVLVFGNFLIDLLGLAVFRI